MKELVIKIENSIRSARLILACFILSSCGQAYFPLELKIASRTERETAQQVETVELVAITDNSIKTANAIPYKRRVIDAGSLTQPARLIDPSLAIKENLPNYNDPGPYKIGIGDELQIGQVLYPKDAAQSFKSRQVVVSDDGKISIFSVGRINAVGRSQSELEDEITRRQIEKGLSDRLEISIVGFNSKKILFFSSLSGVTQAIPYTNNPIFLEDLFAEMGINTPLGKDAEIIVLRNGKRYVLSLNKVLKSMKKKFRLFPEDKVFHKPVTYREENVLVVGETGIQKKIGITSLLRPTLADTIFSGNILNNVTSDFSQIYVIRKKGSKHLAYHLDITNPARIGLANIFEMRPDDIVFVATQPLSLYSRTLSQILGSTGLTLQARDTIRSELRN